MTFDASSVTIRQLGLDRLWSFRHRIEVPYDVIVAAEVNEHPPPVGAAFRIGLDIGVKRSGSFFIASGRWFVNTAGRGSVYCLQLNPGCTFTSIVVSVEQPERLAEQTRARLAAK